MLASLPIAIVAALLGHSNFEGDGVPPASACLPGSGLTELSGCAAMVGITSRCQAMETLEDRLDCACVQDLLDAYQGCKSDIYKCLQMNFADVLIDQNINDWHEICDPRLTSTTITAPPEPTLTSTYNVEECYRLAGSCYRADYETNLCMRSWLPSSSVSFISCACQPPIYSLMSECQFNGNISCKLEPAYESNILGHRECSYFWTGSETLPPVDMTSFLSITDTGMKAAATGEALRGVKAGFAFAQKTRTAAVQTGRPGLAPDDL
ncbi:hypothetical protein B0H67DRAFT_555978 [Lasiosphaeris hirsuta]|uniref:Extracellular membrane protein CFEM domain-containing protein n=1 Tax=Lasiosphaeris hirsuta TaxID=260670 RepID=A0AA40DQU7_9PEZI|nr:hypothetical protein B0H67DRAFT_555978 [Lasiosphaeris hirsuta]